MIISDRTRLIVRIFCLLVLIGLCILVYYNGKDLKCNQCTIQFENTRNLDVSYDKFNISVEKLYNQFIDNESCPLIYNDDGGFIYNGD